MAEPFLGQLLAVGFNFEPYGWAFAAGQILPIAQYTALFSLLGTYYGGNGTANFGLPNLQGAVPISSGQGPGLSDYSLGESGGSPTVVLTQADSPSHNHQVQVITGRSVSGQVTQPANAVLAAAGGGSPQSLYAPGSSGVNQQLSVQAVAVAGSSSPHNNMMPFLAINWIIALQGIFPSRS